MARKKSKTQTEKIESYESEGSVTSSNNSDYAKNENDETLEVKNKNVLLKFGVSFKKTEEQLQTNGVAFIIYTLAVFVLMGIVALSVFLMANKGRERVLVPNVEGKSLPRALLEMQEKELYPKLQLRYSDLPGLAGQVLEQNPKAGTIVKAYRRVTLVVSRGVMVDHIGNYIGTNMDVLKNKLDVLYAGTEIPLITLGTPTFKIDESPKGTILEQYPPEGTLVSQPVELHLIVSEGNSKPLVQIPDFTGKTFAEIIKEMADSKLILEFTSHIAKENEIPGTVVGQKAVLKNEVPEYTRVYLDLATSPSFSGKETDANAVKDFTRLTEDEATEKNAIRDTTNYVHGIFTTELPHYPFALPVKLDAIPQEGANYTVATFNHTGGKVTVPYAVPHGTILVMTVLNQEKARGEVQ